MVVGGAEKSRRRSCWRGCLVGAAARAAEEEGGWWWAWAASVGGAAWAGRVGVERARNARRRVSRRWFSRGAVRGSESRSWRAGGS